MSDIFDARIQQLRLLNAKVIDAAMSTLEDAQEEGSLSDRTAAIREARITLAEALKDEVRYRQTRYHVEAANVLSDAYSNESSVELSGWSSGAASLEELQERAADLLKQYKSIYS